MNQLADPKLKIRLAVYAAAFLILAGVFSMKKNNKPPAAVLQIQTENGLKPPDLSKASYEQKAAAQKSRLRQPWKRDPFSLSAIADFNEEEASLDEGSFVLSGIVTRAGKKSAIINRVFLREGDTLQGVEVTKIARDHVVLTKDEQEIIIRMGTA